MESVRPVSHPATGPLDQKAHVHEYSALSRGGGYNLPSLRSLIAAAVRFFFKLSTLRPALPHEHAHRTTVSLEQLPNELLMHIFRNLDVKALNSVASCSRKMKVIADSDDLWRPLFFKRFCESTNYPNGVKAQYGVRLDERRQEAQKRWLLKDLQNEESCAVEVFFSNGGRCYASERERGMTMLQDLLAPEWQSQQNFLSNLDVYLAEVRSVDSKARESRSILDPALNANWSLAVFRGAWMVKAFLDRGANPEAGSKPGVLHTNYGSALQAARYGALQEPEKYQPMVALLEDAVRKRSKRR